MRPSLNSRLGELQIIDADAGAIDLDYRWPSFLSLPWYIKLHVMHGAHFVDDYHLDLELNCTKLNDIVPSSFTAIAVVNRIETPNIGQDSEADGPCTRETGQLSSFLE